MMEEAVVRKPEPVQIRRPPAVDRCRVLVVEDNRDLRSAIRDTFLMRGFVVNVARDGAEALDLAKDERYDVVVTDLRMPKMDGIRLSRLLRVFANRPKIIVITAFPDWEVEQHDLRSFGAVQFFTKPLDLVELADAVQRAAFS
jgi:DNA-binding response OmpR family regulator